jgi:ADP-dependent NAD(P)H-hydrate dehydratase
MPLPDVDGAEGKEGRGCVLVVGGSEQIPGATILAATAALRAGAGKLQIATSRRVAPWVAIAVPEARVIGLPHGQRGELAPRACDVLGAELTTCDALLIGPGMMDGRGGAELARRCAAVSDGPPLIIDAAALEAFSGRRRLAPAKRALMVLTPHAGEMATLWQISKAAVLADPMAAAQEAAARLGAVVALKGAQTFVAAPDGTTFHNTAGNSGLGTSGSGDTLSGIIAGLCARGADPLRATVWGVYLHARAGDVLARQIGPYGFLARELSGEIPRLLARFGSHKRSG